MDELCELEQDALLCSPLKLKATFRHRPKGHKYIFPESNPILLISVGQEYHEEEKLLSTIELINESGFQSLTIMIGDYIQRYTIQMIRRLDTKFSEDIAMKDGDLWLSRNQKIINQLKIPYQIKRWKESLYSEAFNEYQHHIEELYNNDPIFRNSFIYSALEFIERNSMINNRNKNQIETAKELGIKYLIEECAIILPLWASWNFNLIIYPQKMLTAMEATMNYLLSDSIKDNFYWLPLRFKRLK